MRVNFELPFETLRNSILEARRREERTLWNPRGRVELVTMLLQAIEKPPWSPLPRVKPHRSLVSLTDPSVTYVRTYVRILLRSRFRLTSTRNLQFKSRVHRDDKVSCEATSVNSVNYRYKFQRFSRRGEENSRGTIFSKIIDSEIFRDRRIGWKIRYTV